MIPRNSSSSFPILLLILLTGIFYLNFVSRVILAPLLPILETDMKVGHGGASSLFFFIAMGYGTGLLGSGFIAAWLSHRWAIFCSITLMGIAIVSISRVNSIEQMYGGLVFVGILTGLYLPSGITILSETISRQHWGKALSIHELAPNLGFITAPLLSEALLKVLSWREVLMTMGVISIMMGILFLASGQGGIGKGEPPRLEHISRVLRREGFWRVAALLTTGIGLNLGVYALLPVFLVSEGGMARETANLVTGLSRACGIPVLFFSGAVADRMGPPRAGTLFLATIATFTLLLGWVRGPLWTPLLVFLQASSVPSLMPVGLTMSSAIFPSSFRNVGVSLVALIGFVLGGGLIPSGMGFWAERFSFSSSFLLLGILSLVVSFFFWRGGLGRGN